MKTFQEVNHLRFLLHVFHNLQYVQISCPSTTDVDEHRLNERLLREILDLFRHRCGKQQSLTLSLEHVSSCTATDNIASTLKKLIIWRTSSSNPRSIMRSASSMQRYLQLSSVRRRFSSISMSRPGVATTMWIPFDKIWDCSLMEMPPIHSKVFNRG